MMRPPPNSPSKLALLCAMLGHTIGQVWAITNAVRVFHVSLMRIRSSADQTVLLKSVIRKILEPCKVM